MAVHNQSIETELMWLGKQPMNDCIACFYCQNHDGCVFNDKVNEAAAFMQTCDGLIVASPVFGV